MRAQESPHDPATVALATDQRIAALATGQHGVVAHRQLIELGLGRGAIQHRIGAGRLHPIHRGVYAVGHSTITLRGRWLAAVLASGRGAALSHRDAAALWGLRPSSRAPIDVTAGRSRHAHPGVCLHRSRGLAPEDMVRREGIPITAVGRTLLDLAELLPPEDVERAFEEADRRGLLDLRTLEGLCRRSRGRHGLRTLARLLANERLPTPTTRSELERRFLELCRMAGLPPPAVNVMVAGFEVDSVWLDRRLVVELDGYAFHRTQRAFERDRARDAALQVEGYRVIRVTDRRLETQPAALVHEVRSLLGTAR